MANVVDGGIAIIIKTICFIVSLKVFVIWQNCKFYDREELFRAHSESGEEASTLSHSDFGFSDDRIHIMASKQNFHSSLGFPFQFLLYMSSNRFPLCFFCQACCTCYNLTCVLETTTNYGELSAEWLVYVICERKWKPKGK